MSALCMFPTRVVRATLFAAALFGATAHAQMTGQIGRATIPFQFVSGESVLPAGTYTLSFNSEHIVVLEGRHQASMLMVLPDEIRGDQGGARLVFERDNAGYVLRDIWHPGRQLHLVCVRSKHRVNRELAKSEGGPAVEVVSLN